jgi:hypothetical protein
MGSIPRRMYETALSSVVTALNQFDGLGAGLTQLVRTA